MNKLAENRKLYAARKESGLCVRCGVKLASDSMSLFCDPHAADNRRRAAAAQRKVRGERRKAGRCIYCGGAADGIRCPAHQVKRTITKTLAVNKVVSKLGELSARFERIRAQTILGEDGRTRYHGQLRRGRQSLARLDEKDIDTAITELLKAKDGLRLARAPKNAKLPRIQRKEADHAALSMAHLAIRVVMDALVRNGYPVDVDDLVPDDVEEVELDE